MNTSFWMIRLLAVVAVLSMSGPCLATATCQDETPPAAAGDTGATDDGAEKEVETEEPANTVVKAAPLVITETMPARVESKQATELRIEMDQWTELEVAEAVPQGTAVRAGDTVLRFDTEDFEKRMKEAQLDMQIAELTRNLAEAEFDYAKRTGELDREIAETTWANTRDDIQFYLDVRRPMDEESTQRSLRNSEFSVEYAQEELNQLQKMYEEDELTEESEKIVLERTRRDLDQSQFWLKRNRIETDRELTVDIPRTVEEEKRRLMRGELEYNKAMIELPNNQKKTEVEFEKSRLEHEKLVDEHNKLAEDFAKMILKAPADGIVYHGEFKRGVWSNSSGSDLREIRAKDELTNDSVVMTILDPAQLQLRCDLTEAQAAQVRAGQTAQVTFPALPGIKVPAKVQEVSLFPVEGENHDGVLVIDQLPKGLRPGMTGEAKLVVYDQPNALLVAKSSVFSDNGGISHYVWVLADGKPAKREVTTGRDHDEKYEILSGLAAGDKVLNDKPEEEKPEDK
jgi:HlyD family secretion protein